MKFYRQIFILLFAVLITNCSGTKSATTKTDNATNNEKTVTTENETPNSDKETTRDGSSFKNAFKVNSVAEEYKIVKKLCPNCKMNGQALLSEGNKHYDLLKLTNEKGEEVKYYFDINSFFGKW